MEKEEKSPRLKLAESIPDSRYLTGEEATEYYEALLKLEHLVNDDFGI